MSELRGQAFRFLLVGGANTAVTFVALALLAMVIDPALAYTIVFAAGLAFTTVMTGRFVFSADPSGEATHGLRALVPRGLRCRSTGRRDIGR